MRKNLQADDLATLNICTADGRADEMNINVYIKLNLGTESPEAGES